MTAEFKEVVVTADLFQPQQVLPDLSQCDFYFTDRGFIAACHYRRRIRGGERLTIEFAVGGEREGVERHKSTGQHVLGKVLRELLTQFGWHQLNTRLGQQIGDQALVARLVFAGQHHGFAYTGALHQLSFNFTELDTEAAQFNLKVIAAEIFDVAVGAPAAEIAGLVHPGVRG